MTPDLLIGWLLGLVGSIVSGVALFWLQSRRDIQNEILRQCREDIREAQNWAKNGKTASLRGFDLRGANLSGKDLQGADLEDANLEGAMLWSTNLTNANLIRTNFQNAKIVGTSFKEANLHLADFTGTMIRQTDFSQAKLRRTNFQQAKEITECTWLDAQIDETTKLTPKLKVMIQDTSSFPKDT